MLKVKHVNPSQSIQLCINYALAILIKKGIYKLLRLQSRYDAAEK